MEPMTEINLQYVNKYKDRHGKWRYAFRRGKFKTPLPAPDHPEFSAKYDAALYGRKWEKPKEHGFGTFARILNQYYASPKFSNLKPKSKLEYSRRLDALCKGNEKAILADLTPEMVEIMQAKMKDTPALANATMRYFRTFLNYAVKIKAIPTNPASNIDMYKTGDWRAWTLEECDTFEAHWAPGTLERRLYTFLRYAGQRVGDTAKMTRHDRKRGYIKVVPEKTETGNSDNDKLEIFEHPDITAEINLLPIDQIAFFIGERGKILSSERAGKILKAAARTAGLPEACKPHGLRKRSATDFAEAGCSDRLIMSITGHKTSTMVTHYTKAASQKTRSKAAVVRLVSHGAKSLKNNGGKNG